MSRLAEFRALEKSLADQLAALEALKGDSGLQHEIEFEQKLLDLLTEYGYSLPNIIPLLDPQSTTRRRSVAPIAEKVQRKPRAVKLYKNPHTNEVVETKGGNHKVLKEWKAEHGSDEVEAWLSN